MSTPRHSTIVAYAALFVALGGTATAAGIAANSVGSSQIRNGSVQRADLAKTARPTTRAGIRAVVTDTMTSGDVLNALSTAVEGDPGKPGAKGDVGVAGPQGDQGAKGDAGAQGDRGPQGETGGAWGFGRIAAGPASGSVSGVTYTHPATGLYCLDPVRATQAVAVTPEGDAATDRLASATHNPSSGPCSGHEWVVAIGTVGGALVDHAFYVTVN